MKRRHSIVRFPFLTLASLSLLLALPPARASAEEPGAPILGVTSNFAANAGYPNAGYPLGAMALAAAGPPAGVIVIPPLPKPGSG